MHRIFGDDDTFWKTVGQEVVKTAVNTLVEEGIEATVEIWKKRRLKIQKDELDKRQADEGTSSEAPEPARAGERKSYPGEGSEDGSEDETDDAEAAIFGEEAPARSAGASVDSFVGYVAEQGSSRN